MIRRLKKRTRILIDKMSTRLALFRRVQPPLQLTVIPDHEKLNENLRNTLYRMSQTVPDIETNLTHRPSFLSNKWLSKNNLFKSDDPDIQELRHYIENYINNRFELTVPEKQLAIISMWCIVGRTGYNGEKHSHAGKISGVYYVDPGSDEVDEGGFLQFHPLWKMLAWPAQRYWNAVDGAEYIDGFPSIVPTPGLLVLFPSKLKHSINRYKGRRERIAIAFDLK